MDESFVKELDSSLEVFNTYFPNERDDVDILILRGHQLAETMLYSFIRKTAIITACHYTFLKAFGRFYS
ncbi:MAG: hypothetical protein WBC60_05005 [Cognaticolwellia sp.]